MYHNEKKIGVALAYAAQLVSLLTGLLYTPVMLRLLGQSEYGLYQLVASVVSYLSLFSLGFSSSYNKFYAPYAVKDDKEGIAKLNGMFILVFSVLSALCAVCGIALSSFAHIIFGNGLTDAEVGKARVLFIIMVLNMAFTIFNTVFDCYITAHEKFLFQKLIMLIRNIANPFICLPLLIAGFGSVAMVIVSLSLTILSFIVNLHYCFKKLNMKISFRNPDFGILKDMSRFTFFIFLNQIIDQINWVTDKFLLGRLINTNAVAIYGVASTLNGQYISLSAAISNVFAPKVNRIIAKGNSKDEINTIFIRVGRMQYIVLMLILSGFVFIGKPFIKLWAGTEYSEAYITALLLMGPVTIPIIQNIGIEIQRAMNKHQTRSIVYAVIAILNIIISVFLIREYGVSGAALGTAISLLVGNVFFMNWYYYKKLSINIIEFWKQIFRLTMGMLPAFAIGILIMVYVSIEGYGKLIVYAMIYTVIYSVSLYLIGMNKEEKDMVNTIFSKIRRDKA